MAWNGSGGVEAPKVEEKKSSAVGKGLLMGVIAILVLGVVVYFILKPEDSAVDRQSESNSKTIAEATPNIPAKAQSLPEAKLPMPKLSGERIEKREGVAAPQSLEEMEAAMTNRPPRKKYAFTNGVEQLIALATPPFPGATVPPLPPITDESVAKSLKEAMEHNITAEEGDSEAVLEKKLVVASAKIEFAELRDKEGYGFTEYVNALRDQANEDAKFLAEANKLADEIYHDANVTDEEYIKYREQLNVKLRERGLPEIEKEESEKEIQE